jgi:hypothetical protein
MKCNIPRILAMCHTFVLQEEIASVLSFDLRIF